MRHLSIFGVLLFAICYFLQMLGILLSADGADAFCYQGIWWSSLWWWGIWMSIVVSDGKDGKDWWGMYTRRFLSWSSLASNSSLGKSGTFAALTLNLLYLSQSFNCNVTFNCTIYSHWVHQHIKLTKPTKAMTRHFTWPFQPKVPFKDSRQSLAIMLY